MALVTDVTHKAEYLLPGIFMPEEEYRTLDAYDPTEAAAKAPRGAYCFTIFSQYVPSAEQDERFTVIGKTFDRSKRFYLGGTIHTLPEVESLGDTVPALASNMRANHWPRVIRCITGNWQPFEDGETLLDPVPS